jgi:hypothetical protein
MSKAKEMLVQYNEAGTLIEYITVPTATIRSWPGYEAQEEGMWIDSKITDTSKHTGTFVNLRRVLPV